jgi:hypothetical protein
MYGMSEKVNEATAIIKNEPNFGTEKFKKSNKKHS